MFVVMVAGTDCKSALSDAEVSGLAKKEYYAHSRINELSGALPVIVPDISLKPAVDKEIFPWTAEPNKLGEMVERNGGNEYKILNEIAKIKK